MEEKELTMKERIYGFMCIICVPTGLLGAMCGIFNVLMFIVSIFISFVFGTLFMFSCVDNMSTYDKHRYEPLAYIAYGATIFMLGLLVMMSLKDYIYMYKN